MRVDGAGGKRSAPARAVLGQARPARALALEVMARPARAAEPCPESRTSQVRFSAGLSSRINTRGGLRDCPHSHFPYPFAPLRARPIGLVQLV